MPSLGADMDEGTLLQWLVSPGDTVHRGQSIAVVDTDKAAVEVECFDDGVVENLLVEPGTTVQVGTALATIGAPDAASTNTAATSPEPPKEPEPQPLAERQPQTQPSTESRAAQPPPPVSRTGSPLIRHLAHERGIDLGAVIGTGPGGVVHRSDLDGARSPADGEPHRRPHGVRATPLARRLAADAGIDLTSVAGSGADGAIRAEDVRSVTGQRPAGRRPERPLPRERRRPERQRSPERQREREQEAPGRERGMRSAIAALMTTANREIPHYYLTTTVDLSATVAWLHRRNRSLPVSERIVTAAALLAAVARAARAVPQLNGTWVDGEFRPSRTVELGLIVSLRTGGMLVPIVAEAEKRSVPELMGTIRDLVGRARGGRLRASEVRPASITVSNLGDQGVESILGVIHPPQVALVGIGAVRERPWAVDGMLAVHPVVTVGLSADHRATDGATGARFLNHLDRSLQRPEDLCEPMKPAT